LQRLQIYDAKISFKTRLKGLRYLMYNYRITSFVVFTSLFWFVEMLFTGTAWAVLAIVWPEQALLIKYEDDEEEESIKDENDGQGLVKKEEEAEPSIHEYPPAAEADDEDDEEPGQSMIGTGTLRISDSGIGTSLESSSSRLDPIRRRQKPDTL